MNDVKRTISSLTDAMINVETEEYGVRQDCYDHVRVTLFFDGTENDKATDPSGESWSNVAKLSEIARVDEDNAIYPYYISGVGTNLTREEPWWKLSQYPRDSKLGAATGWGAESRLEAGDMHLSDALDKTLHHAAERSSGKMRQVCVQNESCAFDRLDDSLANHRLIKSIELSVFGFSRGAALARAFVNHLLEQCERRDGQLTYQTYPIRFRFVGLFDTVASFGLPASNLFQDVKLWLPEEVGRCAHFVAAHELRFAFPVTLTRQNGDYPPGWSETVFPGVHSDVGGGYAPSEQGRSNTLARIPLATMLNEAVMAGVPLRGWEDVSTDVLFKDMFEIPEQTQKLYDTYVGSLGGGAQSGAVEQRMQAHMEKWYAYEHAVAGGVSPDDTRYDAKFASLQARIDEINTELHAIYLQKIDSEDATSQTAQVQKLQEERRRLQGELDALNEGKEAIDDGQATIADEAVALREQRERGEPLVIRKVGASDFYLFESRAAEPWMLDAYYGPELGPEVIRFFDTLVHNSKASFLGGNAPWVYFRNRGVAEAVPLDAGGEQANTWAGNLVEAGADAVDDLDLGLFSEFF